MNTLLSRSFLLSLLTIALATSSGYAATETKPASENTLCSKLSELYPTSTTIGASCNNLLTNYKASKWDKAISDASEVLKVAPKTPVVQMLQALSYQNSNHMDEAIKTYSSIISDGADKPVAETYFYRGNAYTIQKKWEEAKADYNKAIELNPKYAEAYNNLGMVHSFNNNPDEAIVKISKAIELKPDYTDAYSNRAKLYLSKKEYTNVIADCDKVLAARPNDASTYNMRGATKLFNNDLEGANHDLQKAIELNPKLEKAHNNLGVIMVKQNKLKEALAQYNKAIELNPKYAQAYLNRADVKKLLGDNEGAEADLKMVNVTKNPSQPTPN